MIAPGGADDYHTGDGAHQGEVLTALMGSTIFTNGHTAVGSADLHIQPGIADGVTDLLVGAAGCEHCEGGGKRNHTGCCQTGSHAHHIALSNATVEMTVGISLSEHTSLGRTSQVGIQNHNISVFLTQFDQSLAVAVTGSHLLNICHITCPPVLPSWHSVQPWPAHTVHRWEPHRANRHCSP